MKNVIKYLLLGLIVVSQFFACGGSDDNKTPADNFDVQFTVPGSVDVTEGGECTFAVTGGGGKSPLTTDTFILESDAGISYVCPIINTSSESFTVRLADGCETGYYKVFVKRDTRKKSFGRIYINIVEDIGFEPDAGTTVYGIVSSAGVGVKNVVVSDGAEVTVTNEEGIYQLKSAKKWGYVFISVPSGYEVPCDGVLPQFHRALKNSPSVVERADFKLEKVDGQDSYKIFMLGDMHLANRTNDLRQFAEGFIAETTAFASAQSVPTYLMVLGDMTWDEFWYSNLYSLSNYRTTMQGYPVPIYHTMGNHDNDPYFAGDFAAEAAYRKALGPTYYSFDVGEVHYVMLDNTVYINTGGTEGSMGKRNYHSYVTDQQLAWLRDDLAALRDKSQPVVVGMHCPAMNNYNAAFENRESFNPAGKTQELFDCFKGFSDVHFLTGHTHYNANMERGAIFEHNVAAVCETWWWAGKLSGVGVCKDGSPAGYAVYEADGRELNWYYKGVGQDRDKQFRTYDMNKVREFYTPAVIEILSQWPRRADDGAGDDYFDVADNTVFINVWNWDSQWTLRVTENGRELPVERVWHRDPLHTICLDYARILNGLDPVNDWESLRHSHMFRVVASSPRTSLHVEATDRFGRRYEETMRRPKEFTADMN